MLAVFFRRRSDKVVVVVDYQSLVCVSTSVAGQALVHHICGQESSRSLPLRYNFVSRSSLRYNFVVAVLFLFQSTVLSEYTAAMVLEKWSYVVGTAYIALFRQTRTPPQGGIASTDIDKDHLLHGARAIAGCVLLTSVNWRSVVSCSLLRPVSYGPEK